MCLPRHSRGVFVFSNNLLSKDTVQVRYSLPVRYFLSDTSFIFLFSHSRYLSKDTVTVSVMSQVRYSLPVRYCLPRHHYCLPFQSQQVFSKDTSTLALHTSSVFLDTSSVFFFSGKKYLSCHKFVTVFLDTSSVFLFSDMKCLSCQQFVQVSFAEYRLFYRSLLQKRPII